MRTLVEHSRHPYVSRSEKATEGEINVGSLQRIAASMELMARNYGQLLDDRNMYERWFKNEQEQRRKAERKASALRGVITRMRGK